MRRPGQKKASLLAQIFGVPFWVFAAVSLAAGAITWELKGPEQVADAILDVARARQVLLEVNVGRAERTFGFTLGHLEGCTKLSRVLGDAHSSSAATGGRLDQPLQPGIGGVQGGDNLNRTGFAGDRLV